MNRENAKEYVNKQIPVFLQRARKIGYVCPICGNGAGPDGTGIILDKKRNRYHCFKCGLDENIIGLYASYQNSEVDRELFNDLYNYYGIKIDDEQTSKPKKIQNKIKTTVVKNHITKN